MSKIENEIDLKIESLARKIENEQELIDCHRETISKMTQRFANRVACENDKIHETRDRITEKRDKIESLKREKQESIIRFMIKNQESLIKQESSEIDQLLEKREKLENEIKELKYTVNSRYDYIDRMRSETQ
jgi:predicted  nucleic acid-binding Zn-ribbon protein